MPYIRQAQVHEEIEELEKEHLAKQADWKAKRKKAFVTFMKSVLEQDKRYSVVPMIDTRRVGLYGTGLEDSSNILGDVMIRREGTYANVCIHSNEPKYGIIVNAGSKMNHGGMQGYPSPSLAWSMINLANELERQFTREVEWEMNKHQQKVITNGNNNHRAYNKNNKQGKNSR
jgi:hypothetical protein